MPIVYCTTPDISDEQLHALNVAIKNAISKNMPCKLSSVTIEFLTVRRDKFDNAPTNVFATIVTGFLNGKPKNESEMIVGLVKYAVEAVIKEILPDIELAEAFVVSSLPFMKPLA